ncbi:MAG: diacylglycerol kinase [Gammaproteobacteria bacterium]|jgi:diacylglycerol kinase (ATP)|nr:diacylglycerol kinase [Gammaproteobacteria bacterium]
MGKSGATGLRRIWNAFFYSLNGLTAAWKFESAFRQECVLAVILIPVALWLAETPLEVALLTGSLIIVIVTELLNSAIEAVVDRVGSAPHALSGQAKDMGSAAVLLALLLVVIVWGCVIWEHLHE